MRSFEFLRIDLSWDKGFTFCMSFGLKNFLSLQADEIARYVDETQDNLLIETLCRDNVLKQASLLNFFTLLVLRMLCQNPDGLFWAGDTAQTISAGSSFRFKDLKAFLHRIEVSNFLCLCHIRQIQILYDTAT